MKTAQEWFDAYGVSHQNRTNKLIHWLCIPLIMFSLFGLLMAIPIPGYSFSLIFNFASLVLVLALVFYFRLSLTLFFGFLVLGFVMLLGNYYLFEALGSHNGKLAIVSALIFAVAWIGQFIGHKIEGVKPSFFEDLQFLMIGPAWLLQFIYKKIGLGI
jgi:uncharacterized membrane protein YGL010W